VPVCVVQFAAKNIRSRKMKRVGGAYVATPFVAMSAPVVGNGLTS
jgi:hypothetical protein